MSIYRTYSADQMEELLSNFLINSWSYSKLSQFARNEKAFEMVYIYGQRTKSSATTIAGQAYHFALDRYFTAKQAVDAKKEKAELLDLPTLEIIAHEYILGVPAYLWKTQKTTPSVEDCIQKAIVVTNALLKNFFSEIGVYLDEIKEVIDVEVYCDEFLSINGVDIPMPCHAKIDLVVWTIEDKLAIIDHKSKTSFTDEQELKLTMGEQAITYVNCYEAKSAYTVDEVWFVENKISKNKDSSPQLNSFKILINNDVRRLYEALLYEPLKRMIAAVQDADYIYLINNSDNFIDKAELHEFWYKTMMAEIDDFPVDPSKRDLVAKRLKKIRDASIGTVDPKVIRKFRDNASVFITYDLSNKNMNQQEKIEHILRSFNILVNVAHQFNGYSSNTYLLEVSAGTKITSIHSHRLDIANALDVSAVRLSKDLVVHNNKSYLAVEFSKERERTLFFEPKDLVGFKIPLGRDNYENVIYWDLDNQSTPHVLACGATGSGKSVNIINVIEYAILAGVTDIVIFDPKYEFMDYNGREGVSVYNEIIAIEEKMAELVQEMQYRTANQKSRKTLIIFDEFADAVQQARSGNELKIFELVEAGMSAKGLIKTKRECTGTLRSLEENLRMILQKGRSTGMRVLAATQRASTKVITGDAKVNFPVQICFRVPKEQDSRVVLDEPGAESLAGMGDGLIKSPEYKDTVRFQAYYKPKD